MKIVPGMEVTCFILQYKGPTLYLTGVVKTTNEAYLTMQGKDGEDKEVGLVVYANQFDFIHNAEDEINDELILKSIAYVERLHAPKLF